MDRQLFDDESIYNMIKWSLRHFVCYCAEYQHDCTFVKKAKMYKDKLQQSIAQSKALLRDKLKLQRQNETLFRKISQNETTETEELRKDLNTYKACLVVSILCVFAFIVMVYNALIFCFFLCLLA